MARRRQSNELLLEKLSTLKEHRLDLRDRQFPVAWRIFAQQLELVLDRLRPGTPSLLATMATRRRHHFRPFDDPLYCKERDDERAQHEAKLARFKANRDKAIREKVSTLVEQMLTSVKRGPILISNDLSQLPNSEDRQFSERIQPSKQRLINCFVANEIDLQGPGPNVEFAWNNLQDCLLKELDRVEQALHSLRSGQAEQPGLYERLTAIEREMGSGKRRQDVADAANQDAAVIAMGYENKVNVSTVSEARKSAKTKSESGDFLGRG